MNSLDTRGVTKAHFTTAKDGQKEHTHTCRFYIHKTCGAFKFTHVSTIRTYIQYSMTRIICRLNHASRSHKEGGKLS